MRSTEPWWRPLRQQVQGLYERPTRDYHNWNHVEACLHELDDVRSLCADADAVEVAIWFHDCIYDVHRHDNEQRSADMAAELLAECAVPAPLIAEVQRLVLATKHNAAPDWGDGELMVDIDLAILGKPTEMFDRYEQAIRQEYTFVAEPLFRQGRSKILQSFLDRPSIYLTDSFRARYEAAARANLSRSIRQLAAS